MRQKLKKRFEMPNAIVRLLLTMTGPLTGPSLFIIALSFLSHLHHPFISPTPIPRPVASINGYSALQRDEAPHEG